MTKTAQWRIKETKKHGHWAIVGWFADEKAARDEHRRLCASHPAVTYQVLPPSAQGTQN